MKAVYKKAIVVATKNLDKFRIVVDILFGLGASDFEYLNLVDLGIVEEMEEVGTIEDRAKQKVHFYKNFILDKSADKNVISIVGVDDGIYIEKEERGTAESKEITELILSDSYVKKGEGVSIQRSYYAYILDKEKEFSTVTKIPFQFLGNPKGITRKDGNYPLSHVLGHLGEDLTIAENPKKERLRYNILHSQQLAPLVQILNYSVEK